MHPLVHDLAIWFAILVAVFAGIAVMFLVLFTEKAAGREDYLKRAARKYSVPPLNLR